MKSKKNLVLLGMMGSGKSSIGSIISKKLNISSFSDYTKVLDDVDAVSISVPTDLHFKIGKFFIENGKHVLIEKPFTKNLSEAIKLEKIAKKKNVVLQIGHIERFNKAYIKLEKLVKSPLFIECNRISPFKVRGTEVDVIMDLMIHDLDIILKLNKSKIKSIHAKGINVLTNNADIANGSDIYIAPFKEPKYVKNMHHVAVVHNEFNNGINIFYNRILVLSTKHNTAVTFVFDKKDCLIGRTTTDGTITARNASQYMGEIHEMSLERGTRKNITYSNSLFPFYDDTLMYLRFEEVDE